MGFVAGWFGYGVSVAAVFIVAVWLAVIDGTASSPRQVDAQRTRSSRPAAELLMFPVTTAPAKLTPAVPAAVVTVPTVATTTTTAPLAAAAEPTTSTTP